MDRLRDRMARELRVRGMAERTVSAYVDDVRLLVERTGVHPARLTEEGIKAYLDDLLEVRQVAPSTFAPLRAHSGATAGDPRCPPAAWAGTSSTAPTAPNCWSSRRTVAGTGSARSAAAPKRTRFLVPVGAVRKVFPAILTRRFRAALPGFDPPGRVWRTPWNVLIHPCDEGPHVVLNYCGSTRPRHGGTIPPCRPTVTYAVTWRAPPPQAS